MTGRRRLPNRRINIRRPVQHLLPSGQTIDFMISFTKYGDGRIAEVFIDFDHQKHGQVNLGHDIATAVSIALQYGAPIRVLRDAMGREEVNWMGKLVERPHTMLGTILDVLCEEEAAPL